MGKLLLKFGIFLAVAVVVAWIFRRFSRRDASGGRDLVGCTGVMQTSIEPGQLGRVRVEDRDGQVIILPAVLEAMYPFVVDAGTEIVVIQNAVADKPIIVTVPCLPGELQ
jgi:membrane protein implicated in regulation of membrane protease activity